MLSVPCKTGSIKVDREANIVQVVQPFGKVLYAVPYASITGLTVQMGAIMGTVTIHSTQANYVAESVSKSNAEKLKAAFPDAEAQSVGKEWYLSPTTLTHVVEYSDKKVMQYEMEQAYQHGWQMQGQSAIDGQSGGMKVLGGAIVAGPLGALMGAASKGKGKTTITYVRTPEWMARKQ